MITNVPSDGVSMGRIWGVFHKYATIYFTMYLILQYFITIVINSVYWYFPLSWVWYVHHPSGDLLSGATERGKPVCMAVNQVALVTSFVCWRLVMVVEPKPTRVSNQGLGVGWRLGSRGLLSCASTSYLGCHPPDRMSLLVVHQGTQNLPFCRHLLQFSPWSSP